MRRTDERGSTLVTVLLIAVVLGVLATMLGREAVADLLSTADTVESSQSLQAAEAGVADYIAKLTEDHSYYDHFTHPAESTRRAAGVDTSAGKPWTGGASWAYAKGKDAWRDLGDGFQYNLEVGRPTLERPTVRIEAAGRLAAQPNDVRTIEVYVRPASIADFQMIANRTIKYGVTSITEGKVYAGLETDAAGNVTTRYDVDHLGTIRADVYAEGQVTGTPVAVEHGAKRYERLVGTARADRSDIRTAIRTPVKFSQFTGSLVDVQHVAEAGGVVLNDTRALTGAMKRRAWWITFQANGTMLVKACYSTTADLADMTNANPAVPVADHRTINGMARGENPTGDVTKFEPLTGGPPVCEPATTTNVPANGAVYSHQDVIVDGVVKGRVTVGTPLDGFIGGNLTYNRPGEDVLGVMANRDILIPIWAPTKLDWRAATISITGGWKSYGAYTGATTDTSSAITFTGSTATNLGGRMNQFKDRKYLYDPNLLYLQPPYWPVLEDAYTVVLFREISD